jgi:hypothetical protein
MWEIHNQYDYHDEYNFGVEGYKLPFIRIIALHSIIFRSGANT